MIERETSQYVTSRRGFVCSSIAALIPVTAGCGSQEDDNNIEPSMTPTSVTTESETATQTDISYQSLFRRQLVSYDFVVVQLSVSEKKVSLAYIAEQTDYEYLSNQIGRASGTFYNLIADGWKMSRLNTTVLNAQQEPIATWFAKKSWFEEFRSGELTSDELSLKILETFSRVD